MCCLTNVLFNQGERSISGFKTRSDMGYQGSVRASLASLNLTFVH
jgi:hypothetical protein